MHLLKARMTKLDPPTYEVSDENGKIGEAVLWNGSWLASNSQVISTSVSDATHEVFGQKYGAELETTELVPKVLIQLNHLAHLTDYQYGSAVVINDSVEACLEMLTRNDPAIINCLNQVEYTELHSRLNVYIVENILGEIPEAVRFASHVLGRYFTLAKDVLNDETLAATVAEDLNVMHEMWRDYMKGKVNEQTPF